MTTAQNEKINWLKAQFDSEELESAFQAFVFKRNLVSNVVGISIGLFLFIIYIFSDFIDSNNIREVIVVRISTFTLCVLILLSLFNKRLLKNHDVVVATAVVTLSLGMVMIIGLQPSLDNTYYIGMIQGFILFGLLLRLSFLSMAFASTLSLSAFAITAFAKNDAAAASLQSANLMGVAIICIAGVYILQRYQRLDFLKALTIERQNTQLNALLQDARRDHDRKLAAMNMLVHFVKTPLHQINGFSDILMNSLTTEEGPKVGHQQIESARYIKDATAGLSKNVNSLLLYHRLDEIEHNDERDTLFIHDELQGLVDQLDETIAASLAECDVTVCTKSAAVKTALDCLAAYYNESRHDSMAIKIDVSSNVNRSITVSIADNGPQLSREAFADKTRPLTKIENYLTIAGSELPMALRTVARAAEVVGGSFDHQRTQSGNVFTFTIADVPTKSTLRTASAA